MPPDLPSTSVFDAAEADIAHIGARMRDRSRRLRDDGANDLEIRDALIEVADAIADVCDTVLRDPLAHEPRTS